MKEKGIQPVRPWMEKPVFISATSGTFEAYVPPEGDGKVSATLTAVSWPPECVVRIWCNNFSVFVCLFVRCKEIIHVFTYRVLNRNWSFWRKKVNPWWQSEKFGSLMKTLIQSYLQRKHSRSILTCTKLWQSKYEKCR